ncbi:Endonuclease V-like protein [Drosera capensis]
MHRAVPCKSFECRLGCNSRLQKMVRATASPPQTPLSAPPPPSISSSPSPEQHQINDWISVQDELNRRVVLEDDFDWTLPDENGEDKGKEEVLRYVEGVDVSFSKEDSAVACGCIVVLDAEAVEVVYEDYCVTRLDVPYVDEICGSSSFGTSAEDENRLRSILPAAVDGGWKWIASSPRKLHHTEGLTRINVGELLQHDSCSELVYLIGSSGHTLGVAMRSTLSILKPIFISVGHRISLATAVKVVKLSCKYRVPEPIRQADRRSREYLRRHPFVSSDVVDMLHVYMT